MQRICEAKKIMLNCRKSFNLIQLLILLNILIWLPQQSNGFEFGFGFGDNDNESNEKQDAAKVSRSEKDHNTGTTTAKRAKSEKKFKFRKIERVYVDEFVNDNEENLDSGDMQAAASSQLNEDEEYQFERAHKAVKDKREKRESDKKKPNKQSKRSRVKDDDDDDDDDNDDDDEQQGNNGKGSWFSGIFEQLFGSDNDDADSSKEADGNTNGIIAWLQWLGEKTGRLRPKPEEPKEEQDSLDWKSYLDRWPFNTFFPMDKTDKPKQMPKRKVTANKSDKSQEDTTVPLSETHFQSLLQKLPSFVVNAANVADKDCRQQLQVFQRQLRGHKLWTLQMLDSTGKLTSGILRGNINQFGDFEMCTQVKTVVKVTPEMPMRIRGKYCLAHIETETDVPALKLPVHLAHGRGLWNSHLGNPGHFVPRYAVANWGVCIPHMCTAEVAQEMIESNLRPYNVTGVDLHVEVNDNDCVMRQNKKWFKLMQKDMNFMLAVGTLLILVVLLLSTTIYEYWGELRSMALKLKQRLRRSSTKGTDESKDDAETETKEETTDIVETQEVAESDEQVIDAATNAATLPESPLPFKLLLLELFKSFSPKSTLSQLLSREQPDIEFPLMNLLKLLATLMLYVSLKFLMIGHLPIKNRDNLVRFLDQPLSILFRAPFIYTDILLLVSGFLSAYQLSAEMEQKLSIQLLKRVAAKVIRYLPTVYVVLVFQTWILPYLGAGPLWSTLVGENSRLCGEQMWRNFFSVQNVIDFEESCSPHTIQLAVEVQLYLLGPLVIWLYYTDADAGFFAYGAIHALSIAARYSRTNLEHLSMTLFHGMNVSKFYRTANMLYSSPITRATPYLLGIGAGLLYRTQSGIIEISDQLVPVGWAVAIMGIVWCFWSPADGMHTDFIYTTKDAASYAAWCPLILGLALIWIIFHFPKEEKSLIRFLLNSRPVLFLSRIAFPMQLIMFVVVLKNTASVKETMNYHLTDLVNPQEIGTIVLLAIVLSFLIDVPAKRIRFLLVQRLFIERPARAEEPENEAVESDMSEAQLSDNEHTAGTTKTPEPAESVWASDPEEEENKYLARRRSSVVINEAEDKSASSKAKETQEDEEEEEEEEEEDDITEVEEVKKRPVTPPPPPPPATVEEKKSTYTRRRRPTSDD